MNRSRALRATAAILATIALPLTTAGKCGSSSSSSNSSNSGSNSSSDCGYSWNPCSGSKGATPPPAPSASVALPTSGAVRWGDWKFGDCALSLWPAYVGLSMSDGHLVILASTACVGYQPTEIHVHITLQKWWSPGGPAGKKDFHDTGVTLADSTPPPLVILPREGEPPLSQQHKISDAIYCTPNSTTLAVPYRLRIDILGVSYGGHPIVTGGFGAAFVVSHWDCA